jgi:hypothetical protein
LTHRNPENCTNYGHRVAETEDLGDDPLGDLARHIMQQISEWKIELEMIRHRWIADVNL